MSALEDYNQQAAQNQESSDTGDKILGFLEDPFFSGKSDKAKAADPNNPDAIAAKNQADEKARQDQLMQQIQTFANEMNAPLDKNDPMVQNVMNTAASYQAGGAYSQGLAGPAAANAAGNAATGAATSLQMQRKQLGLQALQTGTSAGLAQSQFTYGQYLNQLGAEQAKQAGVVGTALGAVGGIAGGIYGGPQGAAAGLKAGQGIGQGIAASGQGVPYGGGGQGGG
jgi:hypothetical protein